MKTSVNSLCPCGSGKKYKRCCQPFHNGKVAKTALELMKSRFSGYAFSLWAYIIKTTHKENQEFTTQTEAWKKEIVAFSTQTSFERLKILEFVDGEEESFVTFEATLTSNKEDISFIEKSRFLKVNHIWYYHSGEFL
jgi:SEC-C motif-containing protein